jgi:hypothetical protein
VFEKAVSAELSISEVNSPHLSCLVGHVAHDDDPGRLATDVSCHHTAPIAAVHKGKVYM